MVFKALSHALGLWLASLALFFSLSVEASEVPLTILHTNDVHSHYRPDRGPFGLGGIGRLATAIRRVRAAKPNTLLLDGGDWSEGQIYYNLDAGRTAVEMLNVLGYDAVVLGNHDWLNGPDQLLKLFTQVKPEFRVLGANLDFSKYPRGTELTQFVSPYQVLKVGGLKVAVMGVVTYELIYDRWFSPVGIKDPFGLTRKLAAKLKQEADLVVLISHNGLATNKLLAGLPNVDVVIHAHDHEKLPQPLKVERGGKTAILVEAQHWGFYLGKLDLLVDTETKKYSVKNYELLQIDETIPEDPGVMALVGNYERQLENEFGDIFHDHLADTTVDIRREGPENLYGNLLTDAYREFTGADASFEQVSLTSGVLYKGPLRSVDLFNALAAIWNPVERKAWTLKTMRMTGETLAWVMNFVLGASSYIPGGLLSVSGVHAVYDPMVLKGADLGSLGGDDGKRPLKLLEVGGKPLEPARSYLVAVPEGINQAIDLLEQLWGNKVERTDVRDTGVEDWRVLAGYVARNSPIDATKLARGGRIAVLQSDLALYHDEIEVFRQGRRITAQITVRNMGTSDSVARKLAAAYDKTPGYFVDDPNAVDFGESFDVPELAPGAKAVIRAELRLPSDLESERVPLYFKLNPDDSDPGVMNDGTWLLVERNGSARLSSGRLKRGQASLGRES